MSLSGSAGLGNGTVALVADISSRVDRPHISPFVFYMSRNFLRIVNVESEMMPGSNVLTPRRRVSAPRAYA